MSVWVNRNIGGNWKKIEVTTDEIKAIRKENFDSNFKTAKTVLKLVNADEDFKKQTAEVQIEVAKILIDRMTTPLHFSIENYVDSQLAKTATAR